MISLENSSPEVLFAVGQYYFTQQDYAKALEYFEKAAKTENKGNVFTSQAKYQLGVMYYDGLGVKEDSVSTNSLCYLLSLSSAGKRFKIHDGNCPVHR